MIINFITKHQDTSYTETKGSNFSTTIGSDPDKGKANIAPMGSTTVSIKDKREEREQNTRATIGNGSIVIAGKEVKQEIIKTIDENGNTITTIVSDNTDLIRGLNRNKDKSQEITKDMITGALDGSFTIDNRIFTPSGWNSIAKDFKNFDENLFKVLKETGKFAKDVATKPVDTGKDIAKKIGGDFKKIAENIGKMYDSAKKYVESIFDDKINKIESEIEEIKKKKYAFKGDTTSEESIANEKKLIELEEEKKKLEREKELWQDKWEGVSEERLKELNGGEKNIEDMSDEEYKKYIDDVMNDIEEYEIKKEESNKKVKTKMEINVEYMKGDYDFGIISAGYGFSSILVSNNLTLDIMNSIEIVAGADVGIGNLKIGASLKETNVLLKLVRTIADIKNVRFKVIIKGIEKKNFININW